MNKLKDYKISSPTTSKTVDHLQQDIQEIYEELRILRSVLSDNSTYAINSKEHGDGDQRITLTTSADDGKASVLTTLKLSVKSLKCDLKRLKDSFHTMQDDVYHLTRRISTALNGDVYIWHVRLLQKLKKSAFETNKASFRSEDFYIAGYCIGLKGYIQKCKDDRYHLGLFMTLKPGKFDDHIEWPYSRRTSFQLLDHIFGVCNVRYEVIPRTVKDSSRHCFERPGDSGNRGYGTRTFIPLDDLEDSSRGYVKSDSFVVLFTSEKM